MEELKSTMYDVLESFAPLGIVFVPKCHLWRHIVHGAASFLISYNFWLCMFMIIIVVIIANITIAIIPDRYRHRRYNVSFLLHK